MSTESRLRELERDMARLSARVPLRQPQSVSPAVLIQVRGAREIYNDGLGFTIRGFQSLPSALTAIPAACWDAGNKLPQQLVSGTTYPQGLGWGVTVDQVPVFISGNITPPSASNISDANVTLADSCWIWARLSGVLPVTSTSDSALVYLPWITAVG